MRFFEVELVGQESQTPPGGFVSDLVHHISQSVDVPADILQQQTNTTNFTIREEPSVYTLRASAGLRHRQLPSPQSHRPTALAAQTSPDRWV